jgi:DNA adenine methylase
MRGPLNYIGGKNRFVSTILPLIPEHTTYVEPFSGGAQIFFHKERSKVEVLNDLDGELVNFYRVCQSHYEELIRYMRFVLGSRDWYQRLQKTPPETLTDIQRAARYFYLQKNTFGGRVANQRFAIHVIQPPTFSGERLKEVIEQTHKRLNRVQIENMPYERMLLKYDRPTTFFYIDPPYYNVRGLYRYDFEHEQFVAMAEQLKSIRGKFLLSVNDHPELRRIFSAFSVSDISVSYSIQKHAGRRYGELLIRNYEDPPLTTTTESSPGAPELESTG